MDGSQRSIGQRRHDLAGAVAPWPISPERAGRWLRSPFLDKVLTYGGGMRRRTHLTGSWASAVTGARCATTTGFPLSFGGGASSWWWRSGVVSCSYDSSATSSGLTSGQEALGWLVAAQRCELLKARVPSLRTQIPTKLADIYRGFDPKS
jgi:hypothetical protein